MNRPVFAVLDPVLAATLPRYQVACGVTDILMHTLDRYFNPVTDNETTDALAEALLRVVLRNGPLVVENPAAGIRYFLVKPSDVAIYVEHGAADVGIVGKDTILEKGGAFYEVLDLGFGRCRFALAVKEGSDFYGTSQTRCIASKYPNVARAFFEKKGMDVDIIKIEGSVELAPILGLADAIVDIVETGSTLRENGLEVLEEICPLSARMVINQVSMKREQERIAGIIRQLRSRIS